MNHKFKALLQNLYHGGGIISKVYEKASDIKVRSLSRLSDEEYIKRVYRENIGQEPNLEEPKNYNEKLQWLKLNDHNPLYSILVDKYRVKDYVKELIGEEYVIPIVGGAWSNADEIDFSSLPEKFVLKCNHDCGSVVVCTNKQEINEASVRNELNNKLRIDYYLKSREWPYKGVKPCIFAEKYMVDNNTRELRDYKFFCFDGKPTYMFIATQRMSQQEETKFDFFDMDYNHLPFTNGHPNADTIPEKPAQFELMKELATKLSTNIPHVRVDFYEANGKVYFGEFTFYHWGGLMKFEPEEWNYEFGKHIILPKLG